MSGRMSNAPVYYALAQATFNPVGAMAKYVNEVQDILRKQGYTLFEESQVTELEIRQGKAHTPDVKGIGKSESWLITRGDQSTGFILGKSSIACHTTHYETRDSFIPQLMQGLEAVHQVVKLDHIRRLGLRYLNAILPRKGESLDDYLDSGLRGVSLDAPPRYALHESVFSTRQGPLFDEGTLVNRVYKLQSRLGYPADLQVPKLKHKPQFLTPKPLQHAVLDTDHFAEGQSPLDFEQLGQQLSNLHAGVRMMFEAATTKHALAAWA